MVELWYGENKSLNGICLSPQLSLSFMVYVMSVSAEERSFSFYCPHSYLQRYCLWLPKSLQNDTFRLKLLEKKTFVWMK